MGDPFCVQVDDVEDDASIGDEDNNALPCSCENVYECEHFEKKHGKVLYYFQDSVPDGSGCGGAWDDDFLEVVVWIDEDGDVLAATHEWNVCSCDDDFAEEDAHWWRYDLERISLYGVYNDGEFDAAECIWKGELKACILEEDYKWLDVEVAFYLEQRSRMHNVWQDYKENELSRFQLFPKDVMRYVMLAWYNVLVSETCYFPTDWNKPLRCALESQICTLE